MWHTMSSGHYRTVSAVVWVVGALWIVAGIATAIALGGGLEDRFEGDAAGSKAKMAPATHLGPATLADASWAGPPAA
jgi:hypothetical protein